MAVAANKSPSSTPSPLTPNNRKRCKVCSKRIYLHQPVLVCGNCSDAYHGKCLRLINYDVFNLQQTKWFCDLCSETNNLTCYACNLSIHITSEKLEICKNCYLPVHKKCSFHKTCVNCIPEFRPSEKSSSNHNYIPEHVYTSLDDDYYNTFTPRTRAQISLKLFKCAILHGPIQMKILYC